MTRADLEKLVTEAVAHIADRSGPIAPETKFVDLDFDSLGMVELFIEINEFNGVHLDDDHWSLDWTVEQLIDDVAKQYGFKI